MSSVHHPTLEGPLLYTCAQAGGQVCVERLWRQHAGRVPWVIRHACCSTLPYRELLHEGQIAVWHAILHYAPARSLAFSIYAVPAIRHRLWSGVAPAQRPPGSVPLVAAADPAELAAQAWQRQAVRSAWQALLACLPERSAHVIVAADGLAGQPPHNRAALGRRYGIRRKRVRQSRKDALVRLRRPALSDRLRRLRDTPVQPQPERRSHVH
jgi:DNA-directed RNA polymerase sigma subunit (sigma70/sigma32)